MAEAEARKLLAGETEPPLGEDQVKAIDEIVREAATKLIEQGKLAEMPRV